MSAVAQSDSHNLSHNISIHHSDPVFCTSVQVPLYFGHGVTVLIDTHSATEKLNKLPSSTIMSVDPFLKNFAKILSIMVSAFHSSVYTRAKLIKT